MKFIVDLLDDSELFGIIFLCDSGVIYTNQVNGVSCSHEQAEGAYIPIRTDSKYTFKPPHNNNNCGSIDADDFDEYFSQCTDTELCNWRVDRQKHSVEAWVYITDGTYKGIFTYSNCD